MAKSNPITGNEFQLNGFQAAFHEGNNIDDFKERILGSLQRTFKDETDAKIVRITYQRGGKTFMANSGYEEQMYEQILKYVEETINREYKPVVYQFYNFISYSPITMEEDGK